MHKVSKTVYHIIFALIFINVVISCKPSQDIPKVNTLPIIASIDLINVVNDKVKIEIKVNDLLENTINYFLPKIVPGTYQNNNYGQFIEDFKAYTENGESLQVKKYGKNQWKISNANELKSITYWVNDTFDEEDKHTVFSPTGTNILKDKNFILNLYAFVGYFEHMKENKYNVFIKRPAHLEASTSKTKSFLNATNENNNSSTDYFAFNRYADMIDYPIMYSEPDQAIFKVNDIEIMLSVYSKSKFHKAANIAKDLEYVIRAQKNFLGNINTTQKYSILLYLSSAKNNDAKGFGALEHNTSTLVVLPESLSHKKLNETLTDVVSHEFFHIVTPLALHSKEIHNFDYNHPKMSEHLWLYEGTTEYFSLLFQIDQGIISKEDFFDRIYTKISTSKSFDDTMAFSHMSKNILQEPYHKNYRNVYEKGALIAMCLDIIMREQSNGIFGILDLIKELSTQFGPNKPFEDKELIEVIEKASYPEISDFLKQHVINNTPIDYAFYLEKVGVDYSSKNIPSSYFIFEQEPFVKGSEISNEVIFSSTTPFNTFLNNLGVLNNDVLISINNKSYTIKNIYDLFGDSNKWKIGDKVTFTVKRNNNILKLSTNVIEPTIKKTILKQNPKASETQKMLFKKWVND